MSLSDALVAKIYEAPLAPSKWGEIVEGVGSLVDAAGGGQFHIFDMVAQRTLFSRMPAWIPEPKERIYNQRYKRIDPRHLLVARASPGAWIFDQDHFDNRAVSRSEIFQFLIENNIRYSAMTRLNPAQDSSMTITFSVFRTPDQRPFDPADRMAVAPALPHLAKAAALTLKLKGLREQAALGAAALDALADGVIVVNARMQIARVNAAAQQLLSTSGPLIEQQHALRCADGENASALRSSVRSAAERGVASTLQLRDRTGRACLWCVVVAIPEESALAAGGGRQVLLVVARRKVDTRTIHAVAHLYGLTAAETRVAEHLVAGLTPQEIGTELQVADATVRTQLRQIFAKTNTRRQAEVIVAFNAVRRFAMREL